MSNFSNFTMWNSIDQSDLNEEKKILKNLKITLSQFKRVRKFEKKLS